MIVHRLHLGFCVVLLCDLVQHRGRFAKLRWHCPNSHYCGESQQFTDEDLEVMKREQSGPTEGMPEVGQDGYVVGDESAPRLEPIGNGPPKRSDDF